VSTHVNPPWKSFLLFLIVGGLGWAGYEFLYVRKAFSGQSGDLLSQDQRDKMRERIVAIYSDDKCFEGVRGNINWRVREDYYRVEIVVADGCEDRAKNICQQIAEMLEEEYSVRSSVWAFDTGGRQVANHVL
jgi:hypothetical protein